MGSILEEKDVLVMLPDIFLFSDFLIGLAQSLYESSAILKYYNDTVMILDRAPRGLISQQKMSNLPSHVQASLALTFAPYSRDLLRIIS